MDVFGSEFKRDNAMRILVFAVVSMWVCSSRGRAWNGGLRRYNNPRFSGAFE